MALNHGKRSERAGSKRAATTDQHRTPAQRSWLPRLKPSQPLAYFIGRLAFGITLQKSFEHRRIVAVYRRFVSFVALDHCRAQRPGFSNKVTGRICGEKRIQCVDSIRAPGLGERSLLIRALFCVGFMGAALLFGALLGGYFLFSTLPFLRTPFFFFLFESVLFGEALRFGLFAFRRASAASCAR